MLISVVQLWRFAVHMALYCRGWRPGASLWPVW